jgi:hypothetical protein
MSQTTTGRPTERKSYTRGTQATTWRRSVLASEAKAAPTKPTLISSVVSALNVLVRLIEQPNRLDGALPFDGTRTIVNLGCYGVETRREWALQEKQSND